MIGKKNVDRWIELIDSRDRDVMARLESIYGENVELLEDRATALRSVASRFREVYGAGEVAFVRAPGRLNTLSMHSDHRGSYINPISLNREIVICYAGRTDDLIEVHNADAAYGSRSFAISDEIPAVEVASERAWLDWTQEKTDERKKAGTNDDWINKLKAVPVYLHTQFPGKKLMGFNGVMSGNIPGGGGLSSSSAVIVALMDIVTDLNGISLDDKTFVRHCGVGEWYVGTRGGAGDHAAIKCGRRGRITHMTTSPELVIDAYLPFPEGYQILIFNSGIKADKTGSAGQKFNEKTATYEIGEIYVRRFVETNHPDVFRKVVESRKDLDIEKKFLLADVVEHLAQDDIYALIESIPERIGRQGLLDQLPDDETLLGKQFATHDEPDEDYPVRLVITYGIAECRRGRMLKEVLDQGHVDMYGKLMCVSHDGDRVSLAAPRFDPARDLHLQPGDYGCSIPEIDEMVDIAMEAGAVGAQISGAGMGGSMMALVREEDADAVAAAMHARYYEPHGIEDNLIVASSIEGAGIL
jgi:N-acetylgalactosamine kinase